MSIGIIIFAAFSLFFWVRAMARQDAGQHLFNMIVDCALLAIFCFCGFSLDSVDGYVLLGILGLDLAGFVVTK